MQQPLAVATMSGAVSLKDGLEEPARSVGTTTGAWFWHALRATSKKCVSELRGDCIEGPGCPRGRVRPRLPDLAGPIDSIGYPGRLLKDGTRHLAMKTEDWAIGGVRRQRNGPESSAL